MVGRKVAELVVKTVGEKAFSTVNLMGTLTVGTKVD